MKKIYKNIAIILAGVLVSIGLGYSVEAVKPSPAPSSNPEVLHVGSGNQAKEGRLGIGGNPFTFGGQGPVVDVNSTAGDLATDALWVQGDARALGGLEVGGTGFTTPLGAKVKVAGLVRSSTLANSSAQAVCADPAGVYVLCPVTTPPACPSGQVLVNGVCTAPISPNSLTIEQTGGGYGNVTGGPTTGSGGTILCDPHCKSQIKGYTPGTIVKLIANSGNWANFASWSGDCSSTSSSGGFYFCFVTIDGITAKNVTANFTPTVSVSTAPRLEIVFQGNQANLGSISLTTYDNYGNPTGNFYFGSGQTCDPTNGLLSCKFPMINNQSVKLTTATSNFVGWGGDCSGSSPSCNLTMAGNKTVSAIFQ